MTPTELRQRAAELEDDVRSDSLGDEDAHGAAALLAALAGWDTALLRQAMLGETGQGNRGIDLLRQAVEMADDEAGS